MMGIAMTKEQHLYRQMHKAKVQVAIATSLLIGSAFLSIYIGFLKVDLGTANENLQNYRAFHVPIPAWNEQPPGVLASTGRVVYEYADGDAYGSNHLASILRLDMATGKRILNFSAPGPSMNVALVDCINEWYDGNGHEPRVLVQFAQVEATETVHSLVEGDVIRNRFYNETGAYRTFIWSVTRPSLNGSIIEITGAIGAGSRAIGVIRLPYNPSDELPDYIIISTNRTWQEALLHHGAPPGGSILYRMHAMHANGSLAWEARSDQPGSLVEMAGYTTWQEMEGQDRSGITTFGFAINATHFVMQHPPDKIVLGDIATGTLAWRAHDIKSLVDFPHDHSGDGIPDIACINSTGHAIFINGVNGSQVPGPAMSLGPVDVQSMRVASRYGAGLDHILAFDHAAKMLRMYKHDGSGISLAWEIDVNGYVYYNWDMAWLVYFNFTGTPLLGLRLGSEGNTDEYRVCLVSTGTTLIPVRSVEEPAILGDFFKQWDGIEVISVAERSGYKVMAIERGSSYLFEIEPMNMVMLFVGIIVGLISGMALIKASRVYDRLSRQEEGTQAVLGRAERSITTTRSTTKPLRTVSTVMLLVVLTSTVIFVLFIIVIGMGNNFYGSANYHAIQSGYITISITFVSLPLIAVLYNHASPRSAMFYIKIQRFFYQRIMRGKKEYKVLVLDMFDYAKRFSMGSIISRSLFPLLVSVTLGLAVFGELASDTSGMSGTSGTINLTWISEFELYAGLTFIASYVFMMLISPGAWLLDDAGVVYFVQPVDVHQPGDISRISEWLTGWLKGFFGFTALLNYYQLFAGTDLASLVNMDDPVQAFFLVVFVFVIIIIASPILYGLIAMFWANASMIDDLEYNRERLYAAMRDAGIDVTPRRLKDFFEKA